MNAPHERTYYPALDGLRGVAILLVVFYHNFGFINYFLFGWLGVDLFFVLSGFLITNILLHTRNKPFYLRNFYARRLLRIVPLYYLSLIIFFYLGPVIIRSVNFSYYIDHQWWFWLYLQNWLLIRPESTVDTTAMHHFWSLAVEEQFYIIWPWVILAIKKAKHLMTFILALLCLVIIGRTYLWVSQFDNFNYFGFYTFTRIDGLCIGSALAFLQFMDEKFLRTNSTWIIFALAGLNFLFYFINQNNNFPYMAIIGYTTFAIIFAMLVYQAVTGENKIINAILRWKLLRFFGTISYSLYIIHWPLNLALNASLRTRLMENLPSLSSSQLRIATTVLLTLAAIIVSFCVYHLFEKQFLKLKKAFA